ncbi:E3 ubiquitin-protein ligase TRAIP-like [Diorhabda sublineata]|uniref:E3 ubiquitin-protein ligase TRAIP-like n=1 Tax=Diorhabda sublineata TaxID=1163346 RepID=UPI0024E175D3|nr:E3 ubiquitin-protein ligase TRAIP-like [Diorhabda sublineata]
MNVTCVICAELFIPDEEIYFTQCGHVFHYHCLMNWIERSKSCPQCRQKLSEKTIYKVFFNFCNKDSNLDATSLTYKLENANFTLSLKEKELKKVIEQNQKLEEINKSLRREIAKIETEGKGLQSTILAIKEQVTHYKNKCKEVDVLSSEILKLKNKIKDMGNIELVINGSRDQVNDILREEHNVESLALLTVTLKKALVDSERKALQLDYKLKRYKNEISKQKKDVSLLESQNADMRREMQQIKMKNEKENIMLKQKIKAFEENNMCATKKMDLIQDKQNSNVLPSSVDESLLNLVASDSPYLPVKNKFRPFLETKFQAPTNVSSSGSTNASSSKNYSIFKLSRNLTSDKQKASTSEVSYDGLGGSSKEDIYPTPKKVQKGVKRTKKSTLPTVKFKKFAPLSVKPKVVDLINLDSEENI